MLNEDFAIDKRLSKHYNYVLEATDMYPYDIFPGFDLYTILLGVGVVGAFALFSFLTRKVKVPAKLTNFILVIGIFAVAIGYFCAVLLQAFYNWEAALLVDPNAKFEITANTGATFYGGLIGGAGVLFGAYFGVGHFIFKEKQHIKHFNDITSSIACSIIGAHGVGRIGCLMAGCCYGMETDSFIGIYMVELGKKVVPTQLFEALFLFALCAVLSILLLKKHLKNEIAIYAIVYGIWRFCIEYLRDDYRGETVVSFLTPSQLVAVIMVLAGIAWYLVYYFVIKKREVKQEEKIEENKEETKDEIEKEA